MNPKRRWPDAGSIAGVAAAALMATTAGLAPGPRVEGFDPAPAGARVRGAFLEIPANTWVQLGSGRRMAVELEPAAASFDLVLGPPDAPSYSAGISDERVGLYDAEGVMIGRGGGLSLHAGQVHTFELRCGPPLNLSLDERELDLAEVRQGCRPQPMSLHAESPLRIRALERDGSPIPFRERTFHPKPALAAGAGAFAVLLLLGPRRARSLALAPLALLLPKLGLPATAGLGLLFGACGVAALLEATGLRRALGGLITALGLLFAAGSVLSGLAPTGLDPGSSAALARALSRQVGIASYRIKVDHAVEAFGPTLGRRPKDKALLLALGSSSSGGSGSGRFWPDEVRERLPQLHVENLAVGGATTWHIRHILDELAIQADFCVLYSGHNDTLATIPGLSLAALERGEAPRSDDFVPPVPAEDARANIAAMTRWCGRLLVMQELSLGREAAMADYAAMLRTVPGATWADGAARLASAPRSVAMLDAVHPTARGHEILGEFVADALKPWLSE